MKVLYAHRLFHGDGCGHSVELSLDDCTYEQDTTVHEITAELLNAFVQDYIETNTHDGDLISAFVDRERVGRFLYACVAVKSRGPRSASTLSEQEKSFITDAELFFEDAIGSAQVKEAA